MDEVILPSGWEACCFGDIAKIRNGYAFKSELFKKAKEHVTDVPLIRQSQMKGARIDISDAVYLSGEFLNKHPDFVIAKGDVIIGMSGSIGKVCLYDEDFPALQNQRTGKIAPFLVSELDPKFFGLFLSNIERKLTEYAKGMGVQNISSKDIEQLPFNLPPKNEQHRIVAKIEELFSELDKGIENLKTAQVQLKVYRQALLKHAFEGKLTAQWREQNRDQLETAAALQQRIQHERAQRYRQQLADWEAGGKQGSKPKAPKSLPPLTVEELAELPELPEGWGWVTLAHIQSHEKHAVKAGPFGSALKKEFYVRDGYKIYGQEQVIRGDSEYGDYFIDESKYQDLASCAVKPFDVLISLVGTIGKVLVLPDPVKPGIINPRLVKVSLNLAHYLPDFFKAYFESGFLRSLYANESQGTTMDILNLGMIQKLPYPLCSVIEQEKILEILDERFSEVDQLEQTIASSLQQAEALRQSILKRAFSGQLVKQDANDEPASVLLERIRAEKAVVLTKPRKPKKTAAEPAPLPSNVIPFPVRLAGISPTDLHAGILARAYQYHENSPQYLPYFGHVKAEKISHLVEAHLGIDLERAPIKDAAGPNDYRHLMKVESRARKAGWFDVRKKQVGDGYNFSKRRGFDSLLLKTENALGDRASAVDELMAKLVKLDTQRTEIVATLYAAWNNLLLLGQKPSDEEIVHEARENWHESKLKIERTRFFKALKWMREHELVPAGRGRSVVKKGGN